ncbi:MAG TPA: MFS transporter [Sphingomonadaceae bacterium]
MAEAVDAVSAMLDGEGGWGRRRWVPVLFGALMFFDSWDILVSAFILPFLTAEWDLAPLQIGWLLSAAYIGQFFGALAFGWLGETFGRKPVFCLAATAMCVMGLAVASSVGPAQFELFRFLQGLALGGALPLAVGYVNEVAPTRTRGRFFSTYQFLMIAGFVAASVSAALLAQSHGWRLLFVIGAAPVVLVPVVWLVLPESPRWLARARGLDAAAEAVRRLGGSPAPVPPSAIPPRASDPERAPLSALFAPALRRVSLVTFALWFLGSLVNYGLATWTPSIFVSEFHIPIASALRYGAIGSIPIFLTPILLGATIDRFGRRPFAIGGAVLATACLAALALMPWNVTLLIVVLTIAGGFGTGVYAIILWPYSSEVFPTPVRALALGIASSLARAASSLTPLFVGGVIGATGSARPVFGIFALIAGITALMWLALTRETARQPMVEHV